ncbi:uncharacterized protein LOC121597637 isoform X2 [Anopheles merus]|uniref:uncharacterized protein LOC121597637 isoform X2 n=1 Tax=Anopheles merus TaxID=30066 RepID=UPI001BE46F05|nr:uncharacterized protein LOC121597637 isoform X2 [Anopheles merus]
MASMIECEEELACLTRETVLEQDQLESTLLWFLSQNFLKSAITKFVSVGDVALLKTMDSDSLASKDNLLMADALAPWKVSNSENLLKARNQVSTNAMELNRLHAQMRSGHLDKELDKCRTQIRELRSKKHSMQYDLNAKQQRVNAEELEMSGLIDVLKEILRDTETTIQCHEQELEKAENSFDDNYDSSLFSQLYTGPKDRKCSSRLWLRGFGQIWRASMSQGRM